MSALAASPDSVVAAFDRTERTLGRKWIQKSRISVGNICRPTVLRHNWTQIRTGSGLTRREAWASGSLSAVWWANCRLSGPRQPPLIAAKNSEYQKKPRALARLGDGSTNRCFLGELFRTFEREDSDDVFRFGLTRTSTPTIRSALPSTSGLICFVFRFDRGRAMGSHCRMPTLFDFLIRTVSGTRVIFPSLTTMIIRAPCAREIKNRRDCSRTPYISPYSHGSRDFCTTPKRLKRVVSAEGIEPSTY